MSGLSFIPIWTLWPILQPKIGLSHLSAYMALKIIWRPQIWYTHSNSECLDPYWFLLCSGKFWPSGGQKHSKGDLVELPASDTWGLSFISQGSILSFLAGCPKSYFLGWYRNFLVYWYLKLDNQAVNSTCPKDKIGWIWQADDLKCRTLIRIRSLPLKSFPDFFLNVLPYQLESWFIQHRLHNILSSCFTKMGSLCS